MKLNRPGIFRVIGEKFELLANVIGEAPLLRITSAISVNDSLKTGKFVILPEDSLEIQEINTNPDKFLFIEYDYSEIAKLPSYRESIRGNKKPDISDEQYRDFVERYKMDRSIPGRGITATKAYIMEKTGWSLGQINVLTMQMAKKYGY